MAERIIMYPSSLSQFGTCKLQYTWAREYRPRTMADHLTFGLAIHHALERYYGHGEDPVKAFVRFFQGNTMILEGLGIDHLSLGRQMMINYLEEYEGVEKFETVATEIEMARRIPTPDDDDDPPPEAKSFYLGARIDALVKDKISGLNYVLEHKTFERFNAWSLTGDHQFVIEHFIANGWSKKFPIEGVIYNGLRKKAEQKGTAKLFERHILRIHPNRTKVVLHRAYWAMRALISPDFRAVPEQGWMCQFCQFKSPCNEYQEGRDYQFILDNTFESRDDEVEEDSWE